MSLHVRIRPDEPMIEVDVDDGAGPDLVWVDDGVDPRWVSIEDWVDHVRPSAAASEPGEPG